MLPSIKNHRLYNRKIKIAEHKGITVQQLLIQHKLIAGACAGMCYWIGTYPLDAIKGTSQSYKYAQRLDWISTVKRMWIDGGVSSFTRGFWPCALRSIPACAMMFTTVDLVRENLFFLLENNKSWQRCLSREYFLKVNRQV